MSDNLVAAVREERDLAIANGECHCGVPASTVEVDGGWSKRTHKYSYNTYSGMCLMFGAATKKLLFIGVKNKYCSVCAISKWKNSPPPSHQLYSNWSGTSYGMEANIIAKGFQLSAQMDGGRYLWFI